ncbi:hypothetical protein ABW20_dc0108510 [Dactylellina cionopaga]|nr:hypothetical protein ABW20_dc0108510 [Dactylellina cionopaga]
MPTRKKSILSLPVEIHLQIFSYLPDFDSQVLISATCSLWTDILLHDVCSRQARYGERRTTGPIVAKCHRFINGAIWNRIHVKDGVITRYCTNAAVQSPDSVYTILDAPFKLMDDPLLSLEVDPAESASDLFVSSERNADEFTSDDEYNKNITNGEKVDHVNLIFKILVDEVRPRPSKPRQNRIGAWDGELELETNATIKQCTEALLEEIKMRLEVAGRPMEGQMDMAVTQGNGWNRSLGPDELAVFVTLYPESPG